MRSKVTDTMPKVEVQADKDEAVAWQRAMFGNGVVLDKRATSDWCRDAGLGLHAFEKLMEMNGVNEVAVDKLGP